MNDSVIPGSFRDPSGHVFERGGTVYRQVNPSYAESYDLLIDSGLYAALVKRNLLIPHEEVDETPTTSTPIHRILRPARIPFISYPYEWCFGQLKEAALATLAIQKLSLEFGMSLKDSTAYNIQFVDNHALLMDTLSFEPYREGEPWVAYRQFCQHFLAPLALIAYRDTRLNCLSQRYIDGVPLDLASALLPNRTYLRSSLLTHLHLHSKSQSHFQDKQVVSQRRKVSRVGMLGILDSLEGGVRKLTLKESKTTWSEYYDETNYTKAAFEKKKKQVEKFIHLASPSDVWDLGANNGVFSRIAAGKQLNTVSFDFDPMAVEQNYRICRKSNVSNLLPLVMDLANPSPAIGWNNVERQSLLDRGPADLAMALALIHHLAISNNVPLPSLAQFFASLCNWLIIEFVPKEDSQVQRMLSTREDIFSDYMPDVFEDEFARLFEIVEKQAIKDSNRTLYLMKKRS